MYPGIFARTFACGSLEASLDAVRATNIPAIQFNLALAGGSSLPSEVTVDMADRICESVRVRDLEMVAISGTYNMAHPDPAERRRGREALSALIAAAPVLGTGVVTLCTGTRDPRNMWRRHPDNTTPAAWADMIDAVAAAVSTADEHGVTVAFEPEYNNVVCDAKTGRRLLDEIASPRLKVVLDAANLIQPGHLNEQTAILDEAFALLGDDIVLAHAKDVLNDGSIVPAGRGGLDYPRFMTLLRQVGYAGAVVLHGLEPRDVADSVSFLRSRLSNYASGAS